MKTLKIGLMTYKNGMHNKIFFLGSNGDWLLSNEQKEVKDLFKVLSVLNDNTNMTYKTIASELRWSTKKAMLVTNILITNGIASIYKDKDKPKVAGLINVR